MMIQDNSDEARTRPRHSHHYASAGDTTPCNPAFRTTRSIRVMATLILVTAFTFLVHKFDYDQLLSGLRPVTIAANSSEQPMTYSLHDENSLTIFIHDNPACLDKIPMLQVIFAAGMNLTSTLCNDLPPWRNVTDLYGEGPIVLGLETCQEYRDLISSHQGAEPRPKVAGLWNTGTTALSRNFNINMELYDDNGTVAAPTVTWGKHTPLRYKYLNTWPPSNKEDRDLILPVVITRDPYRWMDSMCTARYGAKWRSINKRCPNLIPTPEERRQYPDLGSTFVVNHTNYQAGYRFHTFYDSLAQMYSSWYNDYMNASFPRLFIREEDMLFHPEQVMIIIGACTGMPIRTPYHYLVEKGKSDSHTSLVSAMIRYGTPKGRVPQSLTTDEKIYLRDALDQRLMNLLHYPPVPLE